MNQSVTAKGMEVKAKSETMFLQIAHKDTAWTPTGGHTEAVIEMQEAKAMFPVHPFKSVNSETKEGVDFDGTADPVWVTAYSAEVDKATSGVNGTTGSGYTTITNVTTDHALMETFKVRLKPNTGITTATNLKVTGVAFESTTTTDQLDDSLRILFVCKTGTGEDAVTKRVIWKQNEREFGSENSILASSVTNEDTTIDVYIYFDGEDASCTTNAALTPDTYKVSFTLAVSGN
jgi:hypothetical protein